MITLFEGRRNFRHWAIPVFPVLEGPNIANMIGGAVGAADDIFIVK
jgi:hypothetical protein